MRSILGKVWIWTLGTFLLAMLALWGIAELLERRGPGPGDFVKSTMALHRDLAVLAYESEGVEGLAAILGRLNRAYPAEHHLIGATGEDLVSGQDLSTLIRPPAGTRRKPQLADGRLLMIQPAGADGRYRFLVIVDPPPIDAWATLPQFAAVILVITVLAAALAAHLVVPIRRLRSVVERFGRGDLEARSRSTRKDEMGELSRAFDEMAERIETLRTAERRLLQDISHELRSPLARLSFAVELARSSDDQIAALDRIRRDIDRLSCLVDELLQLTGAEGDPQTRDFAAVDANELLGALMDDCRLEADVKACRIERSGTTTAPLFGIPELLRRATENVLRNAIRHAPPGSVIDIRLVEERGRVRILIRDRGPGVPAEALEAIFEPFYRVERDRNRSTGGVGLGLSIARRAVALHGGCMTARNAHPGLEVDIELPMRLSPERPDGLGLPASLQETMNSA